MDKSYHEIRYDKLGPLVVEALRERHFAAWYFPEKDKALDHMFSLIPPGDVISWGGSWTRMQLGIPDLAREKGYKVLDRDAPGADRDAVMRQALTCDTFITSSNAISQDGVLVNVDANGDRMACFLFGPKQVIVMAGMNKVVQTADDALIRARTIAAPLNMQRFPQFTTPCARGGSCADCKSPESICSYITVMRMCKPAGRIKVILVGKNLGL